MNNPIILSILLVIIHIVVFLKNHSTVELTKGWVKNK